jgi:multidrug resistance efflux pump
VRKGQPLFQFDRRPYEDQVRQLEGQLSTTLAKATSSTAQVRGLQVQVVDARRDVAVFKADLDGAQARVLKNQSDLQYAKYQRLHFGHLVKTGAAPQENFQKWTAQVEALQAQVEEARADVERARLKYTTQAEGVNTAIATAQAQLNQGQADLAGANAAVKSVEGQLALARYYLDNTTMFAPADGYITNLQVRPGMVSGIFRVGGIASLIVDSDRYVLASFDQPVLKWVRPGQPVELALDLYPGQIFQAKVDSIWWASGEGQYLPSDVLPTFSAEPPNSKVQTRFAVKISLINPPQRFPIGGQGDAAIYTKYGVWADLRRIDIRANSWLNWLYPVPF